MDPTVPLIITAIAVVFLGLGAIVDDRRARMRRREQVLGLEVEAVLPLLHSINDDRCIGCEACIDVCPTEVLDLVDHKVKVSRFTDCVQCEQCANSCPTQALVMYREGTTPRMLTVPELDDKFMTGVPGQYLIGEIAGKPLVKNAANLGRAVIEHITRDLAAAGARAPGVHDVVIVGSGPAGLSAGLTCLRNKLDCVVLEKEHIISSTVSRYPKGKHFMAEPAESRNVSYLPVFDASKEDLVAAWQRVVAGAKLPIKLGEAVETVKRGDDGVFVIKTTVATYRSRTVVLATGLRGKPRLLVVPGANLEKVQSLLDDPGEFADEHVLVVGGGDSAVEGAMSLADVGATVTLSYRGDGFKRCKQGNQKRLAEMVAAGKLSMLLESNVTQFTEAEVSIKLKDGTLSTIPNHHAFVLIGADTPVTWLEANNVRFVERPHLYALGSTEDVVRRVVPEAHECTKIPDEAIAAILGQQVHRSVGRRVLSAVEHLREGAHNVVTEVSGAFKISDLQHLPPKRGAARTPAKGVRAATNTPYAGVPHVVPASRLAGRATGTARAIDRALDRAFDRAFDTAAAPAGGDRATGAHDAFGPERTVSTASPFGEFGEERTSVSGNPLRPSLSKRSDQSGLSRLGKSTAPLPAHLRSPRPPQPARKAEHEIDNSTDAHQALAHDFDNAFDSAFDQSDVASKPRRAAKPEARGRAVAPRPPARDPQRSTAFDEEDATSINGRPLR